MQEVRRGPRPFSINATNKPIHEFALPIFMLISLHCPYFINNCANSSHSNAPPNVIF